LVEALLLLFLSMPSFRIVLYFSEDVFLTHGYLRYGIGEKILPIISALMFPLGVKVRSLLDFLDPAIKKAWKKWEASNNL
jgi:hypothetical protein